MPHEKYKKSVILQTLGTVNFVHNTETSTKGHTSKFVFTKNTFEMKTMIVSCLLKKRCIHNF